MKMTFDEQIKVIRQWKERQFDLIKHIDNEFYRRILLLICIDTVAQRQDVEPDNLSSSNTEIFTSFLLEYVKTEPYRSILTQVCPVTLYYHYKDKLPKGAEIQLFKSRIYKAGNAELNTEAERILALIPEEQRESARKKHTYARLIYQMRNKLVHEMTSVGIHDVFDMDNQGLPYISMASEMDENGFESGKWFLHIPEKMVWICADESIENYLAFCEENQKKPMVDDDRYTEIRLRWYNR